MKKRKFIDPLKGLNVKFRSGKKLEEWSRFEQTFKAYQIKLKQLFIIYNRYCSKYPSFKKNMEIGIKMMDALKEDKQYQWSEDDLKKNKKTKSDLELCEIDYEDFFLHAKILMDYITRITPFFFDKKLVFSNQYYQGIPKRYFSFHKHKNWLSNSTSSYSHEHIPDEYKEHIIKKTDWFDDLQYFRDKYLVHPFYFGSRGFYYKKDGKTTPIWFHPGGCYTKPVMELPNIEKMMDNILEFLTFLNEFFNFQLTGKRYVTIFKYEAD